MENWDAGPALTALEPQVSKFRGCNTVHIPPSHHSCILNSSKQCLVVFPGNTTTESAENTFFFTALWHNMGQNPSCYDAFRCSGFLPNAAVSGVSIPVLYAISKFQ